MRTNILLKVLFTFLLCSAVINLKAQTIRTFLGLGMNYNAFQDARFSDLQHAATGPMLELGFLYLSEKSYIMVATQGTGFLTVQPNTVEDQITSMHFQVRAAYLYRIIPDFYLGMTWNLLDYTTRNQEGLENGSNFFHTASDLALSGKYLSRLNDKWSLEFGLDLGLVSFSKYAPSFTANMEQKAIDQGMASFQDASVRSPFTLTQVNMKPLWDQFYVSTAIKLYFKRRLSLAYGWNMRTFADQKDYPLTMADHSLTLRYHFISRTK